MTNYDIENELRPELVSGEKLIWTGRPKTGIVFRWADLFRIPFFVLWAGFAIFWEVTAILHGPFFFALWGIPFVGLGLYMLVGRFWVDAKRRGNTVYGMTSDRIIIKTGIFSTEVKSLNIKTLSNITIQQKSDGSGTITLERAINPRYENMEGIDFPGVVQPARFELIEDVKSVYDKIINLQRGINR